MQPRFRRDQNLFRANARLAPRLWGEISNFALKHLKELTTKYTFRIAAGDLLLLDGRWYVTHAGLLGLANRRRCVAIESSIESSLSNATQNHWAFKATAYRRRGRKGFSSYGDADPSNVSPLVRGAEMRIAETRAVNRALRKAYGIGLCSVEELGWSPKSNEPASPNKAQPIGDNGNGHHTSPPRLRDQLCLLIRQYELDPNLVKAYAAHFCGTETIKGCQPGSG